MCSRRDVMDIWYPEHLLNIIPLLTVLTGTSSLLVRANWLTDRGTEHLQEDRNTAITATVEEERRRGVSVSDLWCDLSDSTRSAFKRGAPWRVTLTELCNQLDPSEHEWLRKLLSGSEWRFIITTSLDPLSFILWWEEEKEKNDIDLERNMCINHHFGKIYVSSLQVSLSWSAEPPLVTHRM